MPKKSNFITDSEVPDGHFFDTFGNGVNRKISKQNLFSQIKKQAQAYYYDNEDDLKAADLEADPDNPIYVRVAPAWRLYRITSLAPVAPFDIALDNGATATLDRLENLRAATVDDMKNIPFLKEGDFVETINFAAAQDKGGNTYEIGTFGTADGVFIIDLTATVLQARRMNPVALEADNLQEVKDAPFLYLGDTATTLGYTTAGDGGGNNYEIVAAATGTDDGGSFIDLSGSGHQAKGLFPFGEAHIRQFGAVGDGVADDWAPYRLCMRFCSSNDYTMVIDRGTFLIGIGQGGMTMLGPLRMRGHGSSSVIIREEQLGTTAAGILGYSGTRIDHLEIDSVTFQGQYDAVGEEQATTYIFVSDIDHVRIQNCNFENISYLVCAVASCKDVLMDGNRLDNCARDGLRAISCDKVTISNNKFRRLHDDAIAVHTNDAELITSIIKTQIVISDNNLEECQGIACLGGQNVTVTGNTLTRCNLRGISVSMGTLEGENTPCNITISGNTITDMMARVWSLDGWMTLNWEPLLTGGLTRCIEIEGISADESPIKTYEINADSYPQQPYGLTTIPNVLGGADPISTPSAINISGNTIRRTIPYGSAWSTNGYGPLWAKNGTPPDLVPTSDAWSVVGVLIEGQLSDVSIEGNEFIGVREGIKCQATNGSDTIPPLLRNIKMIGNKFIDIHRASISSYSDSRIGSDFENLKIHGNEFNCDPFYLGVEDSDQTVAEATKLRFDTGAWSTTSLLSNDNWIRSAIIFSEEITGHIDLQNNEFKNCAAVIADNTKSGSISLPNSLHVSDNTIWIGIGSGDFAFSASNFGVAQLDPIAMASNHVYYDSDVASVNFGDVQSTINVSGAIPSSGFYVRGYRIKRSNPASASWTDLVRATTGTTHVVDTDWLRILAN